MEPKEIVLQSSIFHLPAGISVHSVHLSVTELVVRIGYQTSSMPCPECHQPSAHLHGIINGLSPICVVQAAMCF